MDWQECEKKQRDGESVPHMAMSIRPWHDDVDTDAYTFVQLSSRRVLRFADDAAYGRAVLVCVSRQAACRWDVVRISGESADCGDIYDSDGGGTSSG